MYVEEQRAKNTQDIAEEEQYIYYCHKKPLRIFGLNAGIGMLTKRVVLRCFPKKTHRWPADTDTSGLIKEMHTKATWDATSCLSGCPEPKPRKQQGWRGGRGGEPWCPDALFLGMQTGVPMWKEAGRSSKNKTRVTTWSSNSNPSISLKKWKP